MIFWRRSTDWEYINLCLEDIRTSTEALKKWDMVDMDEYHYHDMIIKLALENIKSEMKL